MTTTDPTSLVGIYLPARLAEMLKTTTRLYDRPRYFGLRHTTDNVQGLFEALRSPAQALLASMSIEQRDDVECFAVPLTDLREEARLSLDGFYLFEEERVPDLWPGRERIKCLVTPFEEQPAEAGQEEALLALTMRLSPPWEILPPSYIGCMEVASRISRLTPALLETDPYLTLCLLQVQDRPEQARRYRMAALSAARPDARVLLLGTDTSIFSVFYRKTLRDHPLLKRYWRVLEPAVPGE
jgi:hypothetical protein